MTASFSRLTSGLILGLASLAFWAPGHAASSYKTIDPVQPSDTPGKVEVLEFFAYTCPHCAAIEPLVAKWTQTLPDTAVFRSVPVAFNASQTDLQKLYYALEALGRLDLHPAVFKAIHDEHQRLFKEDAITDWVAEHGVDRQAFTDAFNSFGVQTKVKRADELADTYKVEGTPSFAIGGQYLTSPALTGSYQGAIDETDKLLKQVLAESK